MSPSEIAFLALGIVLGAAVGAALLEAVRARPMPRREVRITVSPHSITPRRPVTLASTDADEGRLTVPGAPDDDGWLERRLAGESMGGGYRTRVPSTPVSVPASAIGIPVTPAASAVRVGEPAAAQGRAPTPNRADPFPAVGSGASIAVGSPDPGPPAAAGGASAVPPAATRAPATDVGRVEDETAVRPRPPLPAPRPELPATIVAVPVDRPAPPSMPSGMPVDAGSSGPPAGPGPVAPVSGPAASGRPGEPPGPPPAPGMAAPAAAAGSQALAGCEDERTLLDERCGLAEAARVQARHAADALHEAQRVYDVLRDRVERAQVIADPREVRAAKDALHRAFRAARDAATTADAEEHAAREWLDEVNRLNTAARDATHAVETGSAELRALLPGLERLAVEADAARITAEGADAGCREAREALARCEEAAALAIAAASSPAAEVETSTRDLAWPTTPESSPVAPATDEATGDGVVELSAIVRILRGDRPARERLVATLAAGDPGSAREWQLRIAGLVDAIAARAIEDGFLDLPDTGFWGVFDVAERREIVGALSALGFRFDGLGGFADGRVPAQRDLSLAVGYAGLERMRIRTWPREEELAGLFADADVAADEWLAGAAGDLALGRMVEALGARATELADVWNAWGRVRPALLVTD